MDWNLENTLVFKAMSYLDYYMTLQPVQMLSKCVWGSDLGVLSLGRVCGSRRRARHWRKWLAPRRADRDISHHCASGLAVRKLVSFTNSVPVP